MDKQNMKFYALAVFVTVFCSVIVYSNYARFQGTSVVSYFGTGEKNAIVVYGDPAQCEIIDIQGNSMYPSLTSDRTIIAENISTFGISNIIIGDVIVFWKDNHYICHRVVTVNEDSFTVRGDNNPVNDPEPILFSDVRFVVIAVLR